MGLFPEHPGPSHGREKGRAVQVLACPPPSANFSGQSLFHTVHSMMFPQVRNFPEHSQKSPKGSQWKSRWGILPWCLLPFSNPFLGTGSSPLPTSCWRRQPLPPVTILSLMETGVGMGGVEQPGVPCPPHRRGTCCFQPLWAERELSVSNCRACVGIGIFPSAPLL